MGIILRVITITVITIALAFQVGAIHSVEDNNMQPLIEEGAKIVSVDADKYYLGQIVLVGETLYRIYAIENDKVRIEDNQLFVNEDLVKILENKTNTELQVNKGEYLVVGDNLQSEIKLVRLEDIKGRVEVIK